MASPIPQPELYWTKPNTHCPNSKLPVLVYRNVLPADHSVESTTKAFEPNRWIKGGVFKHYPTAHYHSNTHECYAAIRGWTKCLYGVGPLDDPSDGVSFEMKAGDIAVHAAGVAHRNTESSSDYEYMGLYPEVKCEIEIGKCMLICCGKGAPHWDNNFCKADEKETEEKAGAARKIKIPDYDPVYGFDGPLPRIWRGVEVK